jgi:hypothetical protein
MSGKACWEILFHEVDRTDIYLGNSRQMILCQVAVNLGGLDVRLPEKFLDFFQRSALASL